MIDLDTGEKVGDRRLWSDFFTTSRRLHEHLLIEQKWTVDYATVAMLVSMILGLFMGWMRFRNSLGGWHRTVALVTAPLLIVTALTGLAIAWGITFAPPPAGAPTTAAGATGAREQITLRRAVQIVANSHDLASVVWIRSMSGGLRARIYDGREANIFAVTERGLTPGNRNWPRALHEGVWAGAFSGLLNLLISLALAGLMMTGLTIWARRTLRRWSVLLETKPVFND